MIKDILRKKLGKLLGLESSLSQLCISPLTLPGLLVAILFETKSLPGERGPSQLAFTT